jgi:ABC-type bacteriocin/lantibiotic exporter with double-glycine peptidase domain
MHEWEGHLTNRMLLHLPESRANVALSAWISSRLKRLKMIVYSQSRGGQLLQDHKETERINPCTS